MNVNLTPPPIPHGDEKTQLLQMRSYLYQMQQQLNIALEQVTPEALAAQVETLQTKKAKLPDGINPTLTDAYAKLKSLIIKTAGTVREEINQIVIQLDNKYVAESIFGTFRENLNSTIVAAADAVVQTYDYSSQLTTTNDNISTIGNGLNNLESALSDANNAIGNINTYNVNTEQYIKTGLLFFDDNSIPRFGVAVGEKLTTVVVDGQIVLERSGLAATFTSDRMSFWQNEVEVAYVSNNQLYINEIVILSRMFLGNWMIDRSNGFLLKWVGE